MERGALSASVIHRAATRYQIDAGPFEVHVIGTRFEVAWDPERQAFSLSLEEGAVRVSGPSIDERVVSAGETFAVSLANAAEPATPVSAAALASSEATSTRPAPEREASASSTVARTSPAPIDQAPVEPAWRMLHLKGEHKAAWALIEAEGVDGVIERASASDLAILADIARFARKPQYATLALKSLRARFPTDPAAADAAFLLGRLAFDQGGSASGAAAWFSTYLAERPNGVFAREAAGRLVECFARSGDTERAKAAAKQYLANYPNGPHAAVARRVLEGTAPTAPDAPNARMPEQETREP
ncbi:MAG: tetratricopeptide repeat protein [Polyangiaceae bacterium]